MCHSMLEEAPAEIIICLTFSAFVMSSPVIVTLVRLLQYQNAYCSMLVTLSGIVMFVRLLQNKNAYSPMLVTEFGIVTLVRLRRPSNAKVQMIATPSEIVTSPFTPAISVLPSLDNNRPFTDL